MSRPRGRFARSKARQGDILRHPPHTGFTLIGALRYAHSQHIESHLGKKQPQAKLPIAFLFSQLHFNNVTSHACFYGSHLVMRSAKPGNHLKTFHFALWSKFIFKKVQLVNHFLRVQCKNEHLICLKCENFLVVY